MSTRPTCERYGRYSVELRYARCIVQLQHSIQSNSPRAELDRLLRSARYLPDDNLDHKRLDDGGYGGIALFKAREHALRGQNAVVLVGGDDNLFGRSSGDLF